MRRRDDDKQGKHLSDKTIGNATIPLRALLSTAVREGVLRNNPAFGLALPHRDDNKIDEDNEARSASSPATSSNAYCGT